LWLRNVTGALDPPGGPRRRTIRIGDRVRVNAGSFVGHSGLCTEPSRRQVGVLLLMFCPPTLLKLLR
jgi:transcription antitermination factor NusG